MADHPANRTIADLARVMEEMQFLIAHPRMQQKRWVAQGRTWMPILQQAHAELEAERTHYDRLAETHQALLATLGRVGLELRQRDRESWGYSWYGAPLMGAYSSQAAALEAALREQIGHTARTP